MGRDDAGECEECLFGDSLLRAAHDGAEERADCGDQLDRGAARRIVSYTLWGVERRDYQLGEGAGGGIGASQHFGEQRGARLGGYGYVGLGVEEQSWVEVGAGADSAEASGDGGRGRWGDIVCGVGPGNVYHRRSDQ